MSGVAPDGSPVDVYRALPLACEDALVLEAVPPPATVLDLGSGPGRIANALVRLGYDVTAVDDSPEMLRHVDGAEIVFGDVAGLRLGRRFDCVLLASNFVNDADDERRRAVLSTAAAHLDGGGSLVAESYPAGFDWDAAVGRESQRGAVTLRVVEAERKGDVVRATVAYELRGQTWRQPFVALMLDEAGIRAELAVAGLRFDRWLAADRGWFVAIPENAT